MKIAAIQKYNVHFLSKNDFDYLDELEKDNCVHSFTQYEDADSLIREKLRNHIYERFLPSYNTSSRINNFATSLEDVNILNLQKLAPNCYRGASLAKYLNHFDLLKKSGVDTIIDLAQNRILENACVENQIEYYPYTVGNDYWGHPIFSSDEELLKEKNQDWLRQGLTIGEYNKIEENFREEVSTKRESFMQDFIKFIQKINNGCFYICCEQGEYRTPNILALNYFFNPKWDGKPAYPTYDFLYKKLKNMYKNMSLQHKTLLGFDEKHEAFLKDYFKRLKL